jgi:hypothetical protein
LLRGLFLYLIRQKKFKITNKVFEYVSMFCNIFRSELRSCSSTVLQKKDFIKMLLSMHKIVIFSQNLPLNMSQKKKSSVDNGFKNPASDIAMLVCIWIHLLFGFHQIFSSNDSLLFKKNIHVHTATVCLGLVNSQTKIILNSI